MPWMSELQVKNWGPLGTVPSTGSGPLYRPESSRQQLALPPSRRPGPAQEPGRRAMAEAAAGLEDALVDDLAAAGWFAAVD